MILIKNSFVCVCGSNNYFCESQTARSIYLATQAIVRNEIGLLVMSCLKLEA